VELFPREPANLRGRRRWRRETSAASAQSCERKAHRSGNREAGEGCDTGDATETLEDAIGPAVFKPTRVYKDKTCLPCNKIVCNDMVCNVPECVAQYKGTPTRYHNKVGCFIYCVPNGGVMDLPWVNNLEEGVKWALKAYHDQLRERPFGKDNPMNDKAVRDDTQKKAGIDFTHVKPTPWVSSAKAKQLGVTSTTTTEEVEEGDTEWLVDARTAPRPYDPGIQH
jgi:hypothetical protein